MPPLLRPSAVVRVTRALPTGSTTTTSSATSSTATTVKPVAAAASTPRSFSLTPRRSGGGGQPESRFDPPTGWLFGVKPGQKYEKEGWETPFYALYCAPIVLMGVFMMFKPDTTIQTWALEEARRRLEKEGILEDPYPDHVEPEDAEDINNKE